MITYLLIAIIVCCVVLIGWVVARKIPLAARIDVELVAGEQESRLKRKLIEERLYRKWSAIGSKLFGWMLPFAKWLRKEFNVWLSAIQSRERSLRVERLKKHPEASDSFDRVRQRVEALIVSEQYSDAESRLVEFIALNPKHIEAYRLLADVAIGKKDYTQAKEIYEFILKLDENNRATYSALGRLYAQEQKTAEATAMFEKSVALHSRDGNDYSALAKLYQSTGENEKAFEAIRRACELQPQNPKFLDKSAELAILLGHKVIAKNAYLKLKKVNPENEKLAFIKEQIDAMK